MPTFDEMIITEEEGLHLIFLTYFTSLSPAWLCWCLAISCMNAPFYPNHFLDIFLQHSALDSRLGGQLFLFCRKVMYCTKRELIFNIWIRALWAKGKNCSLGSCTDAWAGEVPCVHIYCHVAVIPTQGFLSYTPTLSNPPQYLWDFPISMCLRNINTAITCCWWGAFWVEILSHVSPPLPVSLCAALSLIHPVAFWWHKCERPQAG